MHQLMGSLDMSSDELSGPLDDIAADDHGLDIRGPCTEHHHRDRIPDPVEVRRAHVNNRNVGLLTWRQAPDLLVETPHPGAIESCESQHVSLMKLNRLDPLSSRQCGGVGSGALGGKRQAHLGEQVRSGAADGVHAEPAHDSAPKRTCSPAMTWRKLWRGRRPVKVGTSARATRRP
jgi:hypothetical protein